MKLRAAEKQPGFMGRVMGEKNNDKCLNKTRAPEGIQKSARYISIFLLLIFLGISPLLNRMTIIESGKIEQQLTNLPRFFDSFAFFKSQCTFTMGLVSGLMILALVLTRSVKKADVPVAVAASIFVALASVSTLLSPVRPIAVSGLFDRYEGVGVWVGYLLSMVLAMLVMRGQGEWKWLRNALQFLLGIQVIIGFSQFIDKNLLDFRLLKALIVPDALVEQYHIGILNGAGTVYGTINNANFYSQTMALLMVIIFPGIAAKAKNKIPKMLFVGGGACLVFAGSSGGLVGFVAGIFAVSMIMELETQAVRKFLPFLGVPLFAGVSLKVIGFKPPTTTDLLLCGMIPLAFLTGILVNQLFLKRSKRSLRKWGLITLSAGIAAFGFWVLTPDYSKQAVRRISIKDNRMQIDYPDGRLALVVNAKNEITSLGSDGQVLSENVPSGTVSLETLHENIQIEAHKGFSILTLQRLNARFVAVDQKFFIQDSRYLPVRNDDNPAFFGFVGKEKFGTGRGFIWSRSIPMLKRSLIWGIGPDVFPYMFPQSDYAGKINRGDPNILIDKPHNWYLQVAVGTGIVSLLCLLFIWYQTALKARRILKNSFGDETKKMAISFLGFITVYAVTGLFYDSIISVSMWIWPVLGAFVGLLGNADGDKRT
ncbi:MAG: O-antigen ligase family protein [Candidatus Aminicenantes bacterium]|nr:O-antigen ligase family protein [Candidatus Aminicenantes bacterium]